MRKVLHYHPTSGKPVIGEALRVGMTVGQGDMKRGDKDWEETSNQDVGHPVDKQEEDGAMYVRPASDPEPQPQEGEPKNF